MIALSQRLFGLGTLFVAVFGGALLAVAQTGRPIKFSEPLSERGKTNSESIISGRTRLDRWESDLNRPFDAWLPGKLQDGVIMPVPPPPVMPNNRTKDKEDWKHEWMFQKPEDLVVSKQFKDPYKTPELAPDGRRLDDLRPMERSYLESIREREVGLTNRASNPNGTAVVNPFGAFPNSNNRLPGGMSDADRGLRQMLGRSTGPDARPSLGGEELFGLGAGSKPFSKLTEAEIQRRDAFMQIVNQNYVAPVVGATPNPSIFSTRYVDSTFYDPPKPPAPVAPATPALSGGLNGGVMGQGGAFLPTTAPTPPVKPLPAATPSSPFVTIPRRGF